MKLTPAQLEHQAEWEKKVGRPMTKAEADGMAMLHEDWPHRAKTGQPLTEEEHAKLEAIKADPMHPGLVPIGRPHFHRPEHGGMDNSSEPRIEGVHTDPATGRLKE